MFVFFQDRQSQSFQFKWKMEMEKLKNGKKNKKTKRRKENIEDDRRGQNGSKWKKYGCGKKLVWKWFGNGLEMVMANGFNKSRNGENDKTATKSAPLLSILCFLHPIWFSPERNRTLVVGTSPPPFGPLG